MYTQMQYCSGLLRISGELSKSGFLEPLALRVHFGHSISKIQNFKEDILVYFINPFPGMDKGSANAEQLIFFI